MASPVWFMTPNSTAHSAHRSLEDERSNYFGLAHICCGERVGAGGQFLSGATAARSRILCGHLFSSLSGSTRTSPFGHRARVELAHLGRVVEGRNWAYA